RAAVPALIGTLHNAERAEDLEAAAIALCRAGDEAGIDALRSCLEDADWLDKLDAAEDYRRRFRTLRVGRGLQCLGQLPAGQASAALVRLGKSKTFASERCRLFLLIEACGEVRHPSEELLRFLDTTGAPDRSELDWVIRALARMRAPAACRLIERRFFALEEPPLDWFMHALLPVRDDLAIVHLYETLLRKGLDD